MQELREQLQKQHAEKLDQLDEKEKELELNLSKQKKELDKLGDLERQLLEKEARRDRIDQMKERDQSHRMNAEQLVAKLRDEYEKGLDALGGVMEEERKRQFDALQAQIEDRKSKVEEAQRKKEEELARKEEAAKLAQAKEVDRIKLLRAKKEQLTKTLQEGQRLIYKQCYSKPLYSFNKKLNDMQLENEDFAWLNEKKQEDEFAKDIVTRLLHKITELEHNVTTDVRNDVFAKGKDVRDNDTYSEAQSNFDRQSSVNSFRPKLGRDILKKIKNKGRKPKF